MLGREQGDREQGIGNTEIDLFPDNLCSLYTSTFPMHELSIANSILEAVRKERERLNGARVTKVGVRIGELAGVDPEALSFGFEVLVKDTDLEPLALDNRICFAPPRMLAMQARIHGGRLPGGLPRLRLGRYSLHWRR